MFGINSPKLPRSLLELTLALLLSALFIGQTFITRKEENQLLSEYNILAVRKHLLTYMQANTFCMHLYPESVSAVFILSVFSFLSGAVQKDACLFKMSPQE